MLSSPIAAPYRVIFDTERRRTYPVVDALEQRLGFAINRRLLDDTARVLACPLKKAPPNWQHGRVLYTVLRAYLQAPPAFVRVLDIGTAKGFSALCLHWALKDAGVPGQVTSVDVIDPAARVTRNTVAELDGDRTLAEILAPWPEAERIEFVKDTGRDWLIGHPGRLHVAFVDGKHDYKTVSWEAALLSQRQFSGDVIVFDDVHIPGVWEAVRELTTYDVERIDVLPLRAYAIARRR